MLCNRCHLKCLYLYLAHGITRGDLQVWVRAGETAVAQNERPSKQERQPNAKLFHVSLGCFPFNR